jgi:hypothetical protein
MFWKSLIIALLAIILAPIVDASGFFGIHAFSSIPSTEVRKFETYQARLNSTLNKTDSDRSFVALALRPIVTRGSTLLRKAESERPAGDRGTWLTTISNADGQLARARVHCKPIKSIDISKNTEILDSRETPKAPSIHCIEGKKVREMESILADIVLKPPTFSERNSLGAPKPTFSADPAKPLTGNPASVVKKAADTQRIVRKAVRSRVSPERKTRGSSRQASSSSWKNKVWGLPD